MKADELVTESLFYNDNIQVGNNTILYRRWIKKGVCRISHLLHKHGDFLCLGEFNTKYGLNTDFVTYSGCVQAVKKYIKGLGIALQSNKSLSIRKSLTIIGKVQKGTKGYYDILVENKSKPKCCKKWNSILPNNINWPKTFYKIKKIHEVNLKWFQIRLAHRILATNVTLKRMKVTNNKKRTFCNTHSNETIPICFWSCDIVHRFGLMFETFVNEKCLNMINMKLTEDFILFGNAKDFESDEIFDFIILFAKFCIYKC